jgi:predicted transcriptional regulator
MGQHEIKIFLEKNIGKKFSTQQIAKELKMSIHNIRNSCRKAWENNLIEREQLETSLTFLYFKTNKEDMKKR